MRDLVMNPAAQSSKLYHLGIKPCSRAILARASEQQPAALYEAICQKLLQQCRQFTFKGKLYPLDATVINLCLCVFPWAIFRETKGAIKLHVGLDGDGYLPEFPDLTSGNSHESTWAKTLKLPPDSMVVFDMGFTDYKWFQSLTKNRIFFVTRLKRNAKIQRVNKRPSRKAKGITADRAILPGQMSQPLRMVRYQDPETSKELSFVANAGHLDAKIIARR